jgi:hypothetical protein
LQTRHKVFIANSRSCLNVKRGTNSTLLPSILGASDFKYCESVKAMLEKTFQIKFSFVQKSSV